MFKYLRTMNSSDNAPEIIKMRADDYSSYYEGEVCTVNEVGYLSASLSKSSPKYLVVEDKKAGDRNKEINCIKILNGMLFEADLEPASFESMANGRLFPVITDANSHHLFVGSSYGDDVEIISTLNYPYGNKVIVTFI